MYTTLRYLGLVSMLALVGCSSMPKPLFAPPTAPPATPAAVPQLVGVSEDELGAAAIACGFPHAPEDTLRFCLEGQGFRKDGNTISRATPERLAGERAEMERDLWMLQQLQTERQQLQQTQQQLQQSRQQLLQRPTVAVPSADPLTCNTLGGHFHCF